VKNLVKKLEGGNESRVEEIKMLSRFITSK
jgi:hypothetical protein